MGLRFRKRIKIFPGVWLNIGKNRISLSFGGKGVTTNVNSDGAKTTIDLPGTGASYVTKRHTGCLKIFFFILIAIILAILYFIYFH